MRNIKSLEEVKDGGPIFIYGSGLAGRMMLPKIEITLGKVSGFIDSHKDGIIGDMPIFSFERFSKENKEPSRVIIVSMYFKEIWKYISNTTNIDVYNAYEIFLDMQRNQHRILNQIYELS
ncbi:hypothetical protein [Azospirillum humicireducens]|uniref:hypothetical protein n=1 Tax=Azospirillum humicireducens TaxID=1226968 RepID=UPI0011B22BF8|nr:hypothetical protein [Azospirillum humicireducens]